MGLVVVTSQSHGARRQNKSQQKYRPRHVTNVESRCWLNAHTRQQKKEFYTLVYLILILFYLVHLISLGPCECALIFIIALTPKQHL